MSCDSVFSVQSVFLRLSRAEALADETRYERIKMSGWDRTYSFRQQYRTRFYGYLAKRADFFKEIMLFTFVNFFIPIVYITLHTYLMKTPYNFFISILFSMILMAFNILRFKKSRHLNILYLLISFLNIITLLYIGNISFIASIPIIIRLTL